jgi:hypothetical protein
LIAPPVAERMASRRLTMRVSINPPWAGAYCISHMFRLLGVAVLRRHSSSAAALARRVEWASERQSCATRSLRMTTRRGYPSAYLE